MKLVAGVCVGMACAILSAGVARAAIPTAGLNDPVVPGQWHSNLTTATAKAKELNAPMFVVWGDPDCSYCKAFDTILLSAAVSEFFANSGLILVYEHSDSGAGTAIRNWVGFGDWPLTRLTWWQNNVKTVDQRWARPNATPNKTNAAAVLALIQAYFDQYIGDFSPVPADTSKDAYDPDNDTAAGAAELTWGDQPKTEGNLKLAKKTGDEPYADLEDWYKLAVVSGATYRVWFSDVSGIAADAPQAAVYGASTGTPVWDGPEALSDSPEFEFVPTAAGTAYVKVWRESSTDTNILYTLHYQRFAPGEIEFVQNAVAVNENAGSVTLQVRRTGGTSGTATVQIGTEDRDTPDAGYTATAGQDFNAAPAPATLTWADGDAATKTVTFALIKNVNEWEGAETFGVTLTPTTENATGPDAVVTINEVDPMVTRASSYTGLVGGEASVGVRPADRVTGTFQMTVSSAGRITGKAIFPRKAPVYAGSFTIRDARYQTIDLETGIATILGSLVQGRTVVPFELELHMERGSIEGVIGTGENARLCLMFRTDLRERADLLASLLGTYTVAFPVENAVWPEEGAPTGSGYATIKVDTRGRFRASGKLPDGSSYSQSGELFVVPEDEATGVNGLPQAYAVLYGAPSAYQGGLFSGVLCFGDVNENGVWDVTEVDDYPFACVSFKPTSVPVYNPELPGFNLMLGVAGGRYDRYVSLHTVFGGSRFIVDELAQPFDLRYTRSTVARDEGSGRTVTTRSTEWAECVSWQASAPLEVAPNAAGNGFVVPGRDLAKTGTDEVTGQPLYNYETGINPNRFQLRLTSSTGLLRGSFSVYYDYATYINTTRDPAAMRWRHAAKTVPYAGVLLQEQAALADGPLTVGYGHSLYSSRAEYPDSTRTYTVKQSAAVGLLAIPEFE